MSCPSSIWCRDSNPRSSERESPPITKYTTLRYYLLKLSVTLLLTFFYERNYDSKLELARKFRMYENRVVYYECRKLIRLATGGHWL